MNKKYLVILTDCEGDSVVGEYPTLEKAKEHLRSVRYYPYYRRSCEPLDLSDDEMSGTGSDCTGDFTYTISRAV